MHVARAAAEELETIAKRFRSKALAAADANARARVRLADGDADTAEALFSEAARLWGEVGAPYEAAIARAGLSRACRAKGNEHRADLEEGAARAIIQEIAAEPATAPETHLGPLRDDAAASASPTPCTNGFRREGDYWSVTFDGHTTRIRDRKGMRHLAQLLAHPGREFHVVDLVAAEAGTAVPGEKASASASLPLGDAGALLDAQAKAAYRQRLAEIEDDLDEARSHHDLAREAQADAEREFLVRELSRAVGLGGRDRRAGASSERARAGVTRAIRQAMAGIKQHHPGLGEHLERTIRTGTYCSYLPDTRVPAGWDIGATASGGPTAGSERRSIPGRRGADD